VVEARLELLLVLPTHEIFDGRLAPDEEMRARRQAILAEGVAQAGGEPRAGALLLEYGDGPAPTLAKAGEDLDLMVVGSRGFGPLGRVLLGSVSGQLFRTAACPVIAVPRAGAKARPGNAAAASVATT
jgi:nucleotide-binding universal stress UspA family protein